MTTSTFLKMPRRSSFCRASCDFRITCTTNWIMFWCQDLLLTGTNCTESIRRCCVHLHQSNFLPGKLLQFHKLTGPPWFYRARLCALFEPQPEKQECVRNRQQDRVQVRELWDYCLKKNLTSLFSRTSCFGSGSSSGVSMSSGWTPSSGPRMGRGSRLCNTKIWKKVFRVSTNSCLFIDLPSINRNITSSYLSVSNLCPSQWKVIDVKSLCLS